MVVAPEIGLGSVLPVAHAVDLGVIAEEVDVDDGLGKDEAL